MTMAIKIVQALPSRKGKLPLELQAKVGIPAVTAHGLIVGKEKGKVVKAKVRAKAREKAKAKEKEKGKAVERGKERGKGKAKEKNHSSTRRGFGSRKLRS